MTQLCPICIVLADVEFEKEHTLYSKCPVCDSIFTTLIPERVIVTENDTPEERNSNENNIIRFKRMEDYCKHKINTIVDFGCGTGAFLDLISTINSDISDLIGIDKDTLVKLSDLGKETVDVISTVEVIEHLSNPLPIFENFYEILKPGGIIYIETCVVDIIEDPITHGYCDPKIGHCTLYSMKALNKIAQNLNLNLNILNSTTFIMEKQK